MSYQIKELREKSYRLIENARSKLDEITADTDSGRAKEIETEHDAMMAEADALEARATKYAELEKREAAYNEPDARRSVETREVASSGDAEARAAEAMEAYLRGQDLSREQRSLLIRETRAGQSVGANDRGGYLVPQTLADKITVALASGRPMLDASVVSLITTQNGAGLSIPVLNNASQKGRRIAEGASATRNELVFDRKPLDPYKYTSDFIPVTNELLADAAYDLAGFISGQCGELIGRAAHTDMTVGTGTAMPLGIIPGAGTPAVTSGTALKVDADDLIDLQDAVGIQYHRGAKFMFNQKTLTALRKLKDSDGNYIWLRGVGDTPATILGHEYVINQDMANIAANSVSVAFGDFKQYTVRQVGSYAMRRADELGLSEDEVLFIGFARFAGNLIDGNAIKTLKTKAS